ncbi:MAG: hypothetical protein ACM3S2_19390 [Ignavibacteriales bacterium]
MTNVSEDKFSMLKVIRCIIEENINSVKNMPNWAETLERYDTLLSKIIEMRAELEDLKNNKTLRINVSREQLIKVVVKVAKALKAYIISLNENDLIDELLAKVSVTELELNNMFCTELLIKGKAIYVYAAKHAGGLYYYGITNEVLSLMEDKLKEYWKALNMEELTEAEIYIREKQLEMRLNRAINLFRYEINELIDVVKYSNPNFYYNIKIRILLVDLGIVDDDLKFILPYPSMN